MKKNSSLHPVSKIECLSTRFNFNLEYYFQNSVRTNLFVDLVFLDSMLDV